MIWLPENFILENQQRFAAGSHLEHPPVHSVATDSIIQCPS